MIPDDPRLQVFGLIWRFYAEMAVETDWRLFLDHWDDFCYPSDDSNILVLPTLGKAVVYIEERWYVLDNLATGTAFELRGARRRNRTATASSER
jgi:hypothetical protein